MAEEIKSEVEKETSNAVDSTETSNVETTNELQKPTEITVEKTEADDPTDVSTEEIVDNSITKEDLNKIDAEAKAYLDKKIQEDEIDWDKVEFEDEAKMFPKVLPEELDVFCAITEGFIDRESVETYIRIAHTDIESYLEMKAIVEAGQATKDDLEYYDSLSKSKENSRSLLAMIQQDGRKLDKEFKESHIAEDVIKAVTLKACSDYIVNKYRLNNSWWPETDSRHDIDNTHQIRDELLKRMYVSPLFKHIVERDQIKSSVNKKYNMFGPKFYNDHLDDFTCAVRTYITQGNLDYDKLTIDKILTSDFKSFEFMRLPMVYAFKKYDDKIKSIQEWKMTPEEEEKVISRINPNGIFDAELKNLYEASNKVIDILLDKDFVLSEMYIAKNILEHDPCTAKLPMKTDSDWNNSESVLVAISELIPESVTKTNFKEWSKIYKILQKYERYFLFSNLYASDISTEIDEDKKRATAFNVLCGLTDDYYMFMTGELISNLDGFIHEYSSDKEARNILFSTVMTNLICQHELGYRQKLIVDGDDKNVSGDNLYKLAEDVLKDKFVYIIGNKDDDILLKNVDLVETRRCYITDVTSMINFIGDSLTVVKDNPDEIVNAYYAPIVSKSSKKKSRRNR